MGIKEGADPPWERAHDNPYASPIGLDENGSRFAGEPFGPALNPWLSIWTRPRATIRQIVNHNPTQYVLLLAALSGIFETLDRASMRNAGDALPLGAILGLGMIGGPIGGIISLYLGGWALRWAGAQLGGVATMEQVRAAIAWGSVPSLMASVFWVPQLGLLGSEMFTSDTPRLDASGALLAVLLTTSLLEVIAGIWGFVVLLKCLGEVHGFSAWRALGSMLLVVGLVLAAIALLIGLMVAAGALM